MCRTELFLTFNQFTLCIIQKLEREQLEVKRRKVDDDALSDPSTCVDSPGSEEVNISLELVFFSLSLINLALEIKTSFVQ